MEADSFEEARHAEGILEQGDCREDEGCADRKAKRGPGKGLGEIVVERRQLGKAQFFLGVRKGQSGCHTLTPSLSEQETALAVSSERCSEKAGGTRIDAERYGFNIAVAPCAYGEYAATLE